MAKQAALGKGLSALLGGNGADITDFRRPVGYINRTVTTPDKVREGEVMMVSISDIEPNPYQPRINFDEQQLQELSQSIKTLGLIQPITVRFSERGKFQIISGERRFRASRMAGLTSIPAYVRTTDDSGMLELAIVENVQRADLDPIETAMSYKRLIDECKLTQEQMADRIGKSRVSVTNMLRLLRLPAKVQYDVKVGNISIGHAKVLLGFDDSRKQEELSDAIIRKGLSVRALEDLIKQNETSGKKTLPSAMGEGSLPGCYGELEQLMQSCCKDNFTIRHSASGKGSVTVRFSSEAQVEEFLKAIRM